MSDYILTAYNGAILGPIARALGWVMDQIYYVGYTLFGIKSVSVTIILFTVLVYMALLPLTIKQQKFSILSQKMQPEIKAVQEKYKGKRDQTSMMAMQEETQRIYDKYGISPSGSCIQLLIQMPIFFALYRVFYNIPAYIAGVKAIFTDLVNGIMGHYSATWQNTIFGIHNSLNLNVISPEMFNGASEEAIQNGIVDVLYKLPDSAWTTTLPEKFPELTTTIQQTHENLQQVNYFGILNISDTAGNIIGTNVSTMQQTGFDGMCLALIICALLVPVVSYVTQVINVKLMPNANQAGRGMKIMNMIMPIFSLIIAFTVPVGLSIYWITGSVTRSVQQFLLNRKFKKLDLEQIIEANKEKAERKQAKRGINAQQIVASGQMNTRRISLAEKAAYNNPAALEELEKQEEERHNAPAGSMTAIADLVYQFNNRSSETKSKEDKDKKAADSKLEDKSKKDTDSKPQEGDSDK